MKTFKELNTEAGRGKRERGKKIIILYQNTALVVKY